MRTPVRLAAFAVALGVVFAAAVGVGNAVGSVDTPADDPHDAGHGVEEPDPTPTETGIAVKGLAVSQDGYTLRLEESVLPVGERTNFAFSVIGADGHAVTEFTPTHDKDLHLIVVRRDSSGYQHLHPERGADGRWTVPLTLDRAGAYKVFADFAPDGRTDALTLAADVSAAGMYTPQPLPPASRTATVDGYTVTLTGDLVAGRESALTFSVSRDGRPVDDLQPYLAAYGHLVALRAGDLAYLHVHPDGEPGDGVTAAGPDITFYADVPTAADFRLYLDFQYDGVVRTAEFTATARERGAS